MLNIQQYKLDGAPVAVSPDAVACREGIPAEYACPEVPEAYVIRATRDGVEVFHRDEAGKRYGLDTARSLLRRGLMKEGVAVDYPNLPRRAVKVFLPARDKIAEFKRLIDFASHLKYNTVMLELGGAMEYKRHPEINAGWVEYCRFMNEYPGKTHMVQQAFRWEKDSIHSENGGGGWLPQETVRELADYCRQRGMAVIPEVPTLSHSDYLLYHHRELAERADDPWPDTYCPSNPASYELVFDVLEEVIEVFRPQVINIGHDEFYTMSYCPRCRGKSAMLLYANDVNTIAGFLKERGVGTMIWGEKLLNAYFKDGSPIGGSRKHPDHAGATPAECQEAVYPAIDLVDKSVEIMHWYWSIERDLEQAYFERGFRVSFGNVTGAALVDWSRRRRSIEGLMVSNWGTADWVTLQRNGILFELMYDSALLWNARLDSGDYPEIRDWSLRELYFEEHAAIPEERRLELLHATSFHRPFKYFFDGYYYSDAEFLLGHYRVSFDDGSEYRIPVAYGGNIGSEKLSPERRIDAMSDCYEFDRHLAEVSGSALPEFGETTRYRLAVELPRERSAVAEVVFEPAPLLGDARVEFTVLP